jgi:remodeling and spacing factor 1
LQGAGNQGRGKDITTIVNAEKEEKAQSDVFKQLKEDEDADDRKSEKESDEEYKVDKEEDEAEDEEYEGSKNVKAAARRKLLARKKHRKLNSLDISSEDDPYSDEDFKGSSSDEEEEDLDDQVSSSDDSDLAGRRRGRRGEARPVRRSTRARMTRYDEDFSKLSFLLYYAPLFPNTIMFR